MAPDASALAPGATPSAYPRSMRGLHELVPARVHSQAAMAEPAAAFAGVGCKLSDALRFRDECALMVGYLLDPDAEPSALPRAQMREAAARQAGQAFLDGLLVGLYVAGPTAATLPPSALQDAHASLAAELEAMRCGRESGSPSLDDVSALFDLDADAVLVLAIEAGHTYATARAELELWGQALRRYAEELTTLWFAAFVIATRAREEHRGR